MSRFRDWWRERGWKARSRKAEATFEERRRLLQGNEELVAAVSAILFQFDPIGYNTYEYDFEAESIVLRTLGSPSLSVEELTEIVYGEFVHFDAGPGGSSASYVELAEELRRQGLL